MPLAGTETSSWVCKEALFLRHNLMPLAGTETLVNEFQSLRVLTQSYAPCGDGNNYAQTNTSRRKGHNLMPLAGTETGDPAKGGGSTETQSYAPCGDGNRI